MKRSIILLLFMVPILSTWTAAQEEISFMPVKHATFVIKTRQATIYIDPVGDVNAFSKFSTPDIILLTDIHGDHLDKGVIDSLKQNRTIVIGPQAVIDKLEYGEILKNGESGVFNDIKIEAVPMYNITVRKAEVS